MVLKGEPPEPTFPPEQLTPETREQIIRFVKEGVARPWYAPRPNSTDGSLDLVGVSLPAVESEDEFTLLEDDGMDRIGEGKRFLIISLDGNMSVIATPHKELQQRLNPDKNMRSVNYINNNIWDGDILLEVQHGNANFVLRSYIESEKQPLMGTVKATFKKAEETILANKPNQPTSSIKLA